MLVILAAIDAAYSGDWSRIGVISKEVELGLRPLLALLGFFHIFCGGVAAIAASKKGYNPVPPTMKVRGHSLLSPAPVLFDQKCIITNTLSSQVAVLVDAGSGSRLPGACRSALKGPSRVCTELMIHSGSNYGIHLFSSCTAINLLALWTPGENLGNLTSTHHSC